VMPVSTFGGCPVLVVGAWQQETGLRAACANSAS